MENGGKKHNLPIERRIKSFARLTAWSILHARTWRQSACSLEVIPIFFRVTVSRNAPFRSDLYEVSAFVPRVVVGKSRQDPSVDLFVIEHENPEKADLLWMDRGEKNDEWMRRMYAVIDRFTTDFRSTFYFISERTSG